MRVLVVVVVVVVVVAVAVVVVVVVDALEKLIYSIASIKRLQSSS